MTERRLVDPAARGVMRSVDRMLVWLAPVAAVGMLLLGVWGAISGAPVLRVVAQFVMAVFMVITALAARQRRRREEFPDERRA
ncbi:hypothetical protein [Streptomyces sp. NRRL F-5630]|uniref:hypothetical protein n=1 Tax=Streptomyces sp. NRRL F-5630 TaxID=1463864 RepID=UPI003EB887EA